MKKHILLKAMLCCFSFVMLSVMFVACKNVKATKLEIVSGVPEWVYVNETIDLSKLKVKVTYSDGSTKLLTGTKNISYSFNSTQEGEQELVLTLKGTKIKTSVMIQVVAGGGVEDPEVLTFASSLLASFQEGRANFVDKDRCLLAGADNAFSLQIIATVTESTMAITNINTNITIQIWNGTMYQDIDKLEDYATIINCENKIQFTSSAIGNRFMITASPRRSLIEIDPLVYKVEVVDGYNVYTADELSIFGNQDWHGWKAWKEERGLYGIDTNAIVLQANITLRDENIPSDYFWSQSEVNSMTSAQKELTNQPIVGSLKDKTGFDLYRRVLNNNQTFSFYGNYFTIDFQNLSRCVLEINFDAGVKFGVPVAAGKEAGSNDTQVTTHTTLFRLCNKKTDYNGKGVVSDVSFYGNSARSKDTINSGGVVLMKIEGIDSDIDNCSYSNTFLGFLYDQTGIAEIDERVSNTLTKTTGQNCYNTILYLFGCKDLLIEDCEFKSAGGAAMICDHPYSKDSEFDTRVESNAVIINTVLESKVTGQEPWFVAYNATALTIQIAGANTYYTQANATFILPEGGANVMNLKVVYKGAAANASAAQKYRGSVIFFDTRAEYEAQMRENDPVVTRYALDETTYSPIALSTNQTLFQNSRTGAILGQDNTGAYAKVESTGLTHLNIYLQNGMGVVLQLYAK